MNKELKNIYEYNDALKSKLNSEIDTLNDEEKTVLVLHLGLSNLGYKTTKEIALLMNKSNEEIRKIQFEALSKVEPIEGSVDEAVYKKNERLKVILKPKIDKLPSEQKEVITLHFGLDGNCPKTINEISNLLGISAEKVKKLEIKALRNLYKGENDYAKI